MTKRNCESTKQNGKSRSQARFSHAHSIRPAHASSHDFGSYAGKGSQGLARLTCCSPLCSTPSLRCLSWIGRCLPVFSSTTPPPQTASTTNPRRESSPYLVTLSRVRIRAGSTLNPCTEPGQHLSLCLSLASFWLFPTKLHRALKFPPIAFSSPRFCPNSVLP